MLDEASTPRSRYELLGKGGGAAVEGFKELKEEDKLVMAGRDRYKAALYVRRD